MKQLFLPVLLFSAGMLAFSCSSDDLTVTSSSTDEVTVTFTVSQASSVQTRSTYSDGLTATTLTYAVYDAEGNLLEDLTTTKANAFNGTSTSTTVSIQLAAGNDYQVLFWAVAPDSPYEITFDDQSAAVTYADQSALLCNSEDYDAFFAIKSISVTGTASESVVLERPFAQINVGASDLEAYEASFDDDEATVEQTKLVLTNVATAMDLYSSEVTVDSDTELTFAFNAIPDGQTFPVTDDDYDYMAMAYVMAADEQSLADVTFYFDPEDEESSAREISNVPLQRNYQTNIYGDILTKTASFQVDINPDYGETLYVTYVSTGDELYTALLDDDVDVVTLTSDIDYSGTLLIESEKEIDLNDNTLSVVSIYTNDNYTDLTISDGTLELTADTYWGICVYDYFCTLTMSDVEVIAENVSTAGAAISLYNYDDAVLSNVSITSSGSGIVVYDGNTLTLNDCTIDSEYFGISGHGTYPGSTVILNNTNILSSKYHCVYMPNNSSSSVYNTLEITDGTFESEEASAIEVKKTNITVSGATLKSDLDYQYYSLYGGGASSYGFGIALAGITSGTAFEGTVSLSNIIYSLAATQNYTEDGDPWNVVYYDGENYNGVEYEDDGAVSE